MIDDKEIAQKLKPELKRFNLTHEQITAIAIAIKKNPQHLDKCVEYLKKADDKTSGEEIQTEIIDICY